MSGMQWGSHACEMLKTMVDDGRTYAECAAALNAAFPDAPNTYTRAGCIGKASRNGFGAITRAEYRLRENAQKKVRNELARKSTAKQKPSAPTLSYASPIEIASFEAGKSYPLPVAYEPQIIKRKGEPCTLLDLKPRSCRWPLWPHFKRVSFSEQLFCNAVAENSVYCAEHSGIAFNAITSFRPYIPGKPQR